MRLLPLDPADRRSALLLAWLMVLISAATKLGDGVVQALFLERVGARWLPGMFAVNAILDLLAAGVYLRLVRGRDHGTFFVALLAAIAVVTAGMRLLASTGHPAAFFTIHALHEAASMIVTLHWGTYLLDFFDQANTGRAFPVVYAGARLGGMVGGAILATLAGAGTARVGAGTRLPDLLLGVAFFQLAACLAVRRFGRARSHVLAADAGGGLLSELGAGLALARRSPLLGAMTLATVMMVLVRIALRTLSGDALSAAMKETELARFLGIYLVAANAAGFLLQLLLMPRLIERIGVSGANVAYAALSLCAFAAMGVSYGVWSAAGARLVDSELKDSVKTPLSALFYGALAPSERARGRAFILGLVIPLTSVVAGLGLTTLTATSQRSILIVGLPVSALFVLTSWLQNRGYRQALRQRIAALPEGSHEWADLRRALERS